MPSCKAAVLTLVCLMYAFSMEAQTKTYPHTGQIQVVNFDGLQSWLDAYESELLVVNFWATWCKPCVDELYFFEELQARYPEEKVRVLLVSLDFVIGHEERLPAFLDRHDMTLDVALLNDPQSNTWIDRVDERWSGAIPATWLMADGGTSFHEGAFRSLTELDDWINNFKP